MTSKSSTSDPTAVLSAVADTLESVVTSIRENIDSAATPKVSASPSAPLGGTYDDSYRVGGVDKSVK